MSTSRKRLMPNATKDDAVTYVVRIRDGYDDLVDLDTYTLTVTAYNPAGGSLTPTVTAKSPQAQFRGEATIAFADSDITATGTYLVNGKVEGEPLLYKWQFDAEDETT